MQRLFKVGQGRGKGQFRGSMRRTSQPALFMILGIDLGTTNSLAAVFRDGTPQIIPNVFGHALTPSVISVGDDDAVLVGLPARERLSTHPARTVAAFKRWMGAERRFRLGSREFRPEELSALVLKSLKADAERHLGEKIERAVITVPAYFNQAQRKATQAAAEIAGLRADRLLNEPTAAGLAYGLQERSEHSVFLVFDLGGGTFDVSVLDYFEGVVEVRSSAGDTRLGGEDFAQALAELFLAHTTDLPESTRRALRESGALWRAAEQAKRDLSDQPATVMRVQLDEAVYEREIDRTAFETASAGLLSRLRRPIERALMDARIAPGELAEVVLVGGATRMPLIRQMVARLFQRLPLRTINPDETIVRGAAIQAALLARDAALDEVVLTDVMPFSLGVVATEDIAGRQIGDRFSPIIERNMPVPVSRMSLYHTVSDNQKVIRLDIRQGESPIGSENLHLGHLEVPVPQRKAGEVSVEVRLSYDSNGLLAVDAREMSAGTKVSTLIQQADNGMSQAQIDEALKRLEALKVHPRENQENQYLIERAKRLYEDRLGREREKVQHWLAQFEAALDTQDPQIVERARESFREALDSIDNGFLH